MKNHQLSRISTAVVVALGLMTSAMAQETSSSIRGTVVSSSGTKVSGAEVTVFDTRTGATKTLTSNAGGDFTLRGLRVGGPYVIKVTSQEGTKTINDVYLTLGEAANVVMNLQADNIERIEVTGARTAMVTETNGPSSNFNFDDLQLQPSVDRDI